MHLRCFLRPISMASPPSSALDTSSSSVDAPQTFNPSMAIILVVMLFAFFFMALFSIYVRRCSPSLDDFNPYTSPSASLRNRPNQGLDPALLDSLPIVVYSSVTRNKTGCKQASDCVVCLTGFQDNESLRLLPNCKHCFHPDCIDMWLYSHTTCPLCRRNLLMEKGGFNIAPPSVNPASFDEAGEVSQIVVASASNEQLEIVVGEREGGNAMELGSTDIQVIQEKEHDSPILGVISASSSPMGNSNLRRSQSTGYELGGRNLSTAQLQSRFPLLSPSTSNLQSGLQRSRSYTMLSLNSVRSQLQTDSHRADRNQITPSREWLLSLKRAFSLRSSTPQQQQQAAATSSILGDASVTSRTRSFEGLGV